MATIEARSEGPRGPSGASELVHMAEKQSLLFERIPLVEDLQAAWLLLTFCAATRANYWLRTVPREFTEDYAAMHDRSVTKCLEKILHMDGIPCTSGSRHPCHCPWEDWEWVEQRGSAMRHFGAVGPTV